MVSGTIQSTKAARLATTNKRVIWSVYWPTLQFTSMETSYILHKTNLMYAQKTEADGNQATAGVKEEIDS